MTCLVTFYRLLSILWLHIFLSFLLHFDDVQKRDKNAKKKKSERATHPAKVEDLGDRLGDKQDFRPVTTYN